MRYQIMMSIIQNISAQQECMKPCTTVSFSVAVDTFHISETEEPAAESDDTETETVESTGTNKNGSDDSLLLIQFSRLIKYETVRVVAHSTHYPC